MALNEDDIKQLIAILQKGLSSDNDDEPVTAKKTNGRKSKTGTTKNKKSTNNFDKMPEKQMHKEDVEVDQKLHKFAPTPRRGTFKPLKIQCRVCGKVDSVHPSLVETMDRYKCNKCSVISG